MALLLVQVSPEPWLTPWAFALYALALIGLVYGAIRFRVRTLARRAAQLEELVAERTRDLAEANRRLEEAPLNSIWEGSGYPGAGGAGHLTRATFLDFCHSI